MAKERLTREEIISRIEHFLQNHPSGNIALSDMVNEAQISRQVAWLYRDFIAQRIGPDRKILSHSESASRSMRRTNQKRREETEEIVSKFKDRDDLSVEQTAEQAGLSKTTLFNYGIRRKGTEGWKKRLKERKRRGPGNKQTKNHREKLSESLKKSWERRRNKSKE